MREQLVQYVKLLFAGTPGSGDMQQEILQNTLDKYDDYLSQGKTEEAAYRLAIAGIGDISGILEPSSPQIHETDPAPAEVDHRGRPLPSSEQKTMRAVAIAMYICCVIPVIALGNVGNGAIGVCLMFLLIAAATALIILSSSGSNKETEEKDTTSGPDNKFYKAYKSISWIITLVIYLGISFWTGVWYITWLVFPIMGAVDGIIKAIFDLKEAKEHET